MTHRFSYLIKTALAGSAALVYSANQGIAGPPQPPEYIVIDLHDALPNSQCGGIGGGISAALALNNNGQAVGYRGGAPEPPEAIVWDFNCPTGATVLPGLGDCMVGCDAIAWGINDLGQVVGTVNTADHSDQVAFLYLPSDAYGLSVGMNFVTTPNSPFCSFAFDINESGMIVGEARFDTGHAFLWDPTSQLAMDLNDITPILAFGPRECEHTWELKSAWAINDAARVSGRAGVSVICGQVPDPAYVWDATVLIDLCHPICGAVDRFDCIGLPYQACSQSVGYDINNAGTMVGRAHFEIGEFTRLHAARWEGSMAIDIQGGPFADTDITVALAINDGGQIVGYMDTQGDVVLGCAHSPTADTAFIWDQDKGMRDLNLLIDKNSGWDLRAAYDINEAGEIVGYGLRTCTQGAALHAFLLKPFQPGVDDCRADINGDGVVNVLDLIDLILCCGKPAVPGCEAEDVNRDCTVNVLDLIELLLCFGLLCPCG